MINRDRKVKHGVVLEELPNNASIDEVEAAIAVAKAALNSGEWSDLKLMIEYEYDHKFMIVIGNRLETEAERDSRVRFEEDQEINERHEYERLKAKYG